MTKRQKEKASVLLLTLVFAMSLTACKKSDVRNSRLSVGTDPMQGAPTQTTVPSEQADKGVTESKTENNPSTKSADGKTTAPQKATTAVKCAGVQPQPTTAAQTSADKTQPTKAETQNPKTHFTFGNYVAKYFDNNNQSYHVTSLTFHEDYEGLDYSRINYYTKEYCKKRCQENGQAFDEATFYYENEITLNGVTYYDIGDFDALPENYVMTDTAIRTSPDNSKWGEFSLRADGTLVLDSTTDKNRYATVGTVFTLEK